MRIHRNSGLELVVEFEDVIKNGEKLLDGLLSFQGDSLSGTYKILQKVARNVGFPVREVDRVDYQEKIYGRYIIEPWSEPEILITTFGNRRSYDSKTVSLTHELAHHFSLHARNGTWFDYRYEEDELIAEIVVWLTLRDKIDDLDKWIGHFFRNGKDAALSLLPIVWVESIEVADRLEFALENPEKAKEAERRDF